MGCYICSRCDGTFNSNENTPIEDPNDRLGLVCERCQEEMEEDDEGEAEG